MRWLRRLSGRGQDEEEKRLERWLRLAQRAKEEEDKARELAEKLMNGHKHDILARKK